MMIWLQRFGSGAFCLSTFCAWIAAVAAVVAVRCHHHHPKQSKNHPSSSMFVAILPDPEWAAAPMKIANGTERDSNLAACWIRIRQWEWFPSVAAADLVAKKTRNHDRHVFHNGTWTMAMMMMIL